MNKEINEMNGEKENLQSESAGNGEEFDPIQAINELKRNSVTKDEYAKVKGERDKYLKALIDGNQVSNEVKKDPIDVDKLRKDLFDENSELSNLEYAQKALQLREALINAQGVDIFVGKGSKLVPTNEDYEAAQKVAEAFQSCIDVAEGDPEIFTRELMRITKDAAPLVKINPKIRR